MGNTLWKNLYDAVEVDNIYAVVECVEDLEDYLAERWQGEVRKDFERTLRLYIQKSQRMERELVDEERQLPYQLGLVSGFIRAFELMYRKEGERKGIVEALAQCSGKTRQILNVLYQAQDRGMRHGDLADAVGSTASSLTNLMKKVLQSGAVEASRSGKNTYYTLTAAGEQYCTQQLSRSDVLFSGVQRNDLVDVVAEAMIRYNEASQNQPVKEQTIGVGDHVIQLSENECVSNCWVESITSIGTIKYMKMRNDSFRKNAVNLDPPNSDSFYAYSVLQSMMAVAR